MAKKIKIEDYEKEIKEVPNKKEKKDILKISSLIANGLLVICLIIIIVMYESLYSNSTLKVEDKSTVDEKKWIVKPLEFCDEELNGLLNDKTADYVKEKLKFIDDNIVFEIEEFGKYYYSYDCMMKKVDGNFSFWAYNKNAAIDAGLKEGSC